MENASKALIIAGAILLSIVLITLGVLIIGRGQEAIDKTNVDDQVVSSWNQKWTKYEGQDVRGTTVNNMINEVISSNKVVTGNGEKEKVIGIEVGAKASGSDSSNKIIIQGTLPLEKDTGPATSGGASGCTKYANAAGKYNISTFVNTYGYIFKIKVQY